MRPSVKACETQGFLLLTVVILVLFLLITHPTWYMGNKLFESDTKQNLHEVQVALERYAVDHNSSYPLYLTGGEGRWAAQVNIFGKRVIFSDSEHCPDIRGLADPLSREGYMPAYPRNPFARAASKRMHVFQAQLGWPLSPAGGDPLRNGCAAARLLGTRFGADCGLMGNVLPDKRYPYWIYGAPDGKTEQRHTWADVEYQLWDIYAGEKPKPYLPGEIIYRSTASPNYYRLGAYGSRKHKGQDVLSSTGDPYGDNQTLSGEADRKAANGIPDAICIMLQGGVET
jgi:hypothetical protein